MKFFFSIIFLLVGFSCFCQPAGATIVERNGIKCYVHTVLEGNTLYGLHKLYSVPVEEIKKVNNGIQEDLIVGTRVIIPVIENKTEGEVSTKEIKSTPIIHKVKAKETLYGISKQYNVTIESLRENNPLLAQGLKIGSELKILGAKLKDESAIKNSTTDILSNRKSVEKLSLAFTDSVIFKPDAIVKHKVTSGETLYSISKRYMTPLKELYSYNDFKPSGVSVGDIINVPIKNDNGKRVGFREIIPQIQTSIDTIIDIENKDFYTISVLLPFYVDRYYSDNLELTAMQKMVSNLSVEFYMGLKIAVDSLEQMGLKAVVQVYDTENDSVKVNEILNLPSMLSSSLVIGPLFSESVVQVSEWCKAHKIRMVCPVSSNISCLKENLYVDIAIPSDFTLIENAAKRMLEEPFSKQQLILIKPQQERDIALYNQFREKYYALPCVGERKKIIEATLKDYKTFIPKGQKTMLILLSTDESTSLSFISNLISYTNNSNNLVSVLGTKEWINFENMNGAYRNKFNFHFTAPNDFSFENEKIKDLARKYRLAYNSELTKISALGFDVLCFFSNRYFLNELTKKEGVLGNYNMIQKGEGNGFENSSVEFFLQKDFELIKLN